MDNESTPSRDTGMAQSPVLNQEYSDVPPSAVTSFLTTPHYNTIRSSTQVQSAPPTLLSSPWSRTINRTPHMEGNPEENGVMRVHQAKQLRGVDLKARLYDHPQNAQVYQTIQNKVARPQKLNGAQPPLAPRPPAGKAPGPSVQPAFRTMMYRRDHEQRKKQQQLKQKTAAVVQDGGTQLATDGSNGHPSDETLQQDEPQATDAVENSEVQDKEAQASLQGDGFEKEADLPNPELVGQEGENNIDVAMVTDEEKAASEAGSVRRKSAKRDPKKVLTYKLTNVYDTTVPADDDAANQIIKMRQSLGWRTELPLHGPGVREAMKTIDDVDPMQQSAALEQDSMEITSERQEDDGSYLYALLRERHDTRSRHNPYNLQVVSANTARANSSFHTVSASYVTLVEQRPKGGEDLTMTPVMTWMYERRLFNMIYKLPVFEKFRIWKAFTVWKGCIRGNKNTGNRTVLQNTLFCANDLLQRCLLHIRDLCEAASSSRTGLGESGSAILLVHLDRTQTLTLQDFCKVQQDQCNLSLQQLNTLRRKVVQLVWDACAKVAENEGITYTKDMKANKPVMEKSKASGKKKDGPTYTQIAEWRQILLRLSCFIKLADNLIVELLRRLVITATRHLVAHVSASATVPVEYESESDSEQSESEDEDRPVRKRMTLTEYRRGRRWSDASDTNNPHSKKQASAKKAFVIPKFDFDKEVEVKEEEPVDIDQVLKEVKEQGEVEITPEAMFKVSLVLNVPTLPSRSTVKTVDSRPVTQEVRSNVPSSLARLEGLVATPSTRERKTVTFIEGGMSELQEEEETEEDDSDVSESEDEAPVSKPVDDKANRFQASMDKISSYTGSAGGVNITLSPSQEEFRDSLRGVISTFENTVGQVKALLRDPRLSVFYSPPTYDLKLSVDEEKEEEERELQRPWPDIELLFGEDPDYQDMITTNMDHLENALGEVLSYAEDYTKFTVMVDKARRVDVDASMTQREWTTEEFHHVLSQHTEQVRSMMKMRTHQRIGMMEVFSNGFQGSCLPFPKEVLAAINRKLPVIANKKNEELMRIIKGASKKLDNMPESVEEFVEHLTFLGRMVSELPILEREFTVVTRLFVIAKNFEVPVPPEELALYQTLAPSFQHLKSTILYCEAKKDDNIRKFSTDLDKHINNLRFELVEIKSKVRDPNLLNPDTLTVVATETLKTLMEEVEYLSSKARSYANYQDRFGSSISAPSKMRSFAEEAMMLASSDSGASAQIVQADLSEVERDVTLRQLLWESLDEWAKLEEGWRATAFEQLNVDAVQKNVNRFSQTVFMLEKGLPHNEIVPKLKQSVLDFKQGMPVITSLRNPYLRSRHWEAIQELIGRSIVRDKKFTLGNLLELKIFQHKERIGDISTQASNEATLEAMLQKVIELWHHTDFRLVPHNVRPDIMIIAGIDDIMAQLEESQVTIGTIRGSRYVTAIKTQVEDWDRRLGLFARTLDEWMTCQRQWLYLEQIFTTPDIQRQLPTEAKLFSQVDKSWKDLMRRTEDRPNALRSATAPGVLEILQSSNSHLEKIQKCLEDYLETKRLVFPRFYFLSNDELLDILAQSKNPDAVQPHLRKCFGNIVALDIRKLTHQPAYINSMTSAEGETIPMPKNVRARGPVEQWLGSVETSMYDTVKKHLKSGMVDWNPGGLTTWVLHHPGQVVLTVAQIMFNRDVVKAFRAVSVPNAVTQVRDNMVDTLTRLARLVSTPMHFYQRMTLEALLIIDVHNRDILKEMIDNKVYKSDDFGWTKQLRYEWNEHTNSCNVLQCNATFQYGYEYLGCSPRLVITPLTDRCYLTLTSAQNLHLGGSPAGPAGTGKTETVKDLARVMGKQCVVFNCSEAIDYKMMGRLFSGMAQSGSWCCFDEFNRIDVEVLSVIAQQIHTIKTAKDGGALRFLFEGRDIRLNMSCGFFITMNPGYKGRVELPDNLKSLFRQVAMMVPDYALIAEIMLFSEGFTAAKSLSTKIVNLYQLASKQLSQQDHYDFGMRAIKSVLVMAGQRKSSMQEAHPNQVLNEQKEAHILIQALRDANLPKFLAEDVPLFESILADLFPGIVFPEPESGVLEKAINVSIRDLGLQPWPLQLEKVVQLYRQIMVRHGVMLVGPTGGGKTTCRNILQRALVLMPSMQEEGTVGMHLMGTGGKKGKVETFTLNPKCVKLGELYGATDPNTLEWTDGLMASAVRRFARELTAGPETQTDEWDQRPPTTTSMGSGYTRTGTATPATPEADMEPDVEEVKAPEGEMSTHKEEVPTDWRWLVLDGPVDTLWVENLNTVLDDTKTLCLANGERISLPSGIRLTFEVDNLSQASPATISRCAMVYMDPVDLGWRPFVKTWLTRLPRDIPETGRTHLEKLFELSIDDGLAFTTRRKKHQHLPATDLGMVSSLCKILSALLDFMGKNGGFGAQDDTDTEERPDSASSRHSSASRSSATSRDSRRHKKKRREERRAQLYQDALGKKGRKDDKKWYMEKHPRDLAALLGKMFVFAFTWSIGGNLVREDDHDEDAFTVSTKEKEDSAAAVSYDFDNFIHDKFEIEPPLGVRLPTGNKSIFSYFVDMQTGNFVLWDSLVPTTQSLIERGLTHVTLGEAMGMSAEQSRSMGLDSQLIPTVDTVRYSFLMALLLLHKNPILLTGDSGVGKSAIVQDMLSRLTKDGGTATKGSTILGSIFHYAERSSNILENISSLTSGFLGEKQGGDSGSMSDMVPSTAGSTVEVLSIGSQGVLRPKVGVGVIASTFQFSAQTSAARTQHQITNKLIKKGKDAMGGPRGKKVLVFIDDLNMPAPEQYGAQPPLELLRQYLELGGFYDTKKLTWKNVLDVTLVGACAPPGGGRNQVSARLLKHFSMLCLPQPSSKSLQHIYQVQLGRFFENGDFMPEVKECQKNLVSAGIAVYYKMCGNMLPTPAKSHYTFNLRDLSEVIRGLLQADETVIVSRETAAQLFAHEATRVFHDRLVDDVDRMQFHAFLSDDLHNYFKVSWTADKLCREPVMFGDFLDMHAPSSVGRVYRYVSNKKKLAGILEEYHNRLTMGSQEKPLVFFTEAVEHITRAARVFRQPGGHMMMVGLDGTGKASSTELACHISQCELYKLNITRNYLHADFRDDLKKVFHMAGVQGNKTVLLLNDADIIMESFLEDVNSILNSGEVPDLFDNDELDAIAMELKSAALEAGIPDTRQAVYQLFIQRVQTRLHIVLAMSPAGHTFRQRCRAHPALINCCTIDWYNEWPEEALLSVAHAYFSRIDFGTEEGQDTKDLRESVAGVCVDIHSSVTTAAKQYYQELRRFYYTTPTSYLELIQLYSRMLESSRQLYMNSRDRLLVGLSKLSEANSLVGTMQEELVALGPKIEEKARDTELLMQQLAKDQEAVDEVRLIVEEEEQTMAKEAKIIEDYAEEATRDLQSVLPALQTAITALDALDKSDISEIRVYTNPPVLVMTVMSAVCTLLQQKPDWATAKQQLSDPSFLKRLVTLDKNSIPNKVWKKLKQFSKHPDFTPERVGGVSLACKSMCQWVLALEHYMEVYRMVEPKQQKVREAKEALEIAKGNLKAKQESLAKIQEHLRILQQQYQDSVNQRESLRERKVLTTKRLERASILTTALADERVRWKDSAHDQDVKLHGVVGDTLLSAANVGYLGVFNAPYRRLLVSQWLNKCQAAAIPVSKDYTLVNALSDKNKVRQWHNEGLPQDKHSVENAVVIKSGHRWPLIIDPQGQGKKWICGMEGERLKTLQAADPNYLKILENAIRVGEPVLLEEVGESLDPGLHPILVRKIIHRGGQDLIRLGDTEIEFNQNFRLYMTTSMPNPHFLPAVCIKVNIINFTVTFEGLQEQLLSTVVQQERPDLEQQHAQLLESIAADLQLLRDLEDKSLSLLQKSEGHILDDQDLIETLQRSKKMSAEITQRVGQSEETEKNINQARQKYLPVATRGAVLYFVLADLAMVDVMYQFSLPWFQRMFRQCVDYLNIKQSLSMGTPTRPLSGTLRPQSARSSPDISHPAPAAVKKKPDLVGQDLTAHLMKMIDTLTESVYKVVSQALFAHHQLMFSFLLCTSIMRNNAVQSTLSDEVLNSLGGLVEKQWLIFLHTPIFANMMDAETEQQTDGLTPMQRLEMQAGIGSDPSSPSLTPSSSRRSSVSGSTPFIGKSTMPKWLTAEKWRQCQYICSTMEDFSQLCHSLVSNPEQWQLLLRMDDPYHAMATRYIPLEEIKGVGSRPSSGKSTSSRPGSGTQERSQKTSAKKVLFKWQELSAFQRLILIKILQPEMLKASIRSFVEEKMGIKFLSTGDFDLKEVFEESDAQTPLIFILSHGSDPAAQLMRFAKEVRGSTLHIDMISLGRGQGPKAEELIQKAHILKGRWVFLQNCHLAASFMPRLQAIVDSFNKPGADIDPQFRLWLSSKPDPCFPITILQTGLKMTVELPQGLKANLQRSFGSGGSGIVTDQLYEDAKLGPSWKNLLFGLCMFNAVVHERKKYGPLGYNIPYAFTSSDLEVSLQMLQALMVEEDGTVPWSALLYLTGEVVYGGRVTDAWDRRCLHSILQRFLCPEALNPGYSYSSDGLYQPLPTSYSLAESRAYIDALPNSDSPDIFGMHENAENAFLRSQASELIETIISVQPRLTATGVIGSGKSSDEIVLEVISDISQHLPETVEQDEPGTARDRDAGSVGRTTLNTMFASNQAAMRKKSLEKQAKGEKVGQEDPDDLSNSALVTVLRQEIDRYNRLLAVVHSSLRSLTLAVKGEVVMSEHLEEAYNSFLVQRVPEKWQEAAYESCKPLGSWVKDLAQRTDFFSTWAELVIGNMEKKMGINRPVSKQSPLSLDLGEGEVTRDGPRSFWLSGFFFPQGFLTGVLQNHARKTGVSVDSLTFDFHVKTTGHDTEEALNDTKQGISVLNWAFKQGQLPPEAGVLVFGLYLDGARWDPQTESLQDTVTSQQYSRLPEIHFDPVQVAVSQLEREASSVSDSSTAATTEPGQVAQKRIYECPLYRTSRRAGNLSSTGHSTNFVTAVNLPSMSAADHWVTRGVAMLCQLDD
ncbi:PREDICTED: LOW QUALITY PROTEIN: dynein heavy chain 6, axonemal-like [Branchiostoma belcheri]|uniref:LOW QUALITY PROTEIN: dynein heavy chain 6, axonemal-like n=1 Tax=Branchiostoma belcheri TaxID=7741 RepID=A0A6P4YA40_BRABE|nr:PREDICTED: LOW QUALITY PROTEIN: dynein heavy chain 6, axonemal-like [Branchiostoma belcheri]